MSFLGIERGEGSRHAAQRNIELKSRGPLRGGLKYLNGYDLLRRHGQWFGGVALPEKYEGLVGPQARCHWNSLMAALKADDLKLFTGLYVTGAKTLFHSWCVEPDGGVVELTYPTRPDPLGRVAIDTDGIPWIPPEHWTYVGVEYDPAFVFRAQNAGLSLPLLDPHPDHGGDYIFHYAYDKSGFPLDNWRGSHGGKSSTTPA